MEREREKVNAAPVPKSKFKPNVAVRKQKAAAVKAEQPETKADLVDKELLAKLNNAKVEDKFGRRRNADSKSATVEVAFGQRSGYNKRATTRSNHEDHADVQSHSKRKEYIEPWDYENSNYPICLPLRLPNSGDPEILDKEEFEKHAKKEESVKHAKKEESAKKEDIRKIVSPAEELGLMDANNKQELFFFQLPEVLPFIKQPSAAVDQKSNKVENANTAANLKDLPSGRLGKMMVYRSGKIKMKMGDTLFDSHRDSNNMQIEDHQNNKSSESLVKRKCKLLGWEKVVAEGTIASTDPNASVHFVKLGQDVWKV